MDYAEIASITVHDDWSACVQALGVTRLFGLTTKGKQRPTDTAFKTNDSFVFGSESKGLPQGVLADIPENQRLRLPLMPGNRSLNLSNAVAILVYEAWRQHGFAGGG
jgi:tRNA (cytidine/uridine-2'-O-)-methyltransferase